MTNENYPVFQTAKLLRVLIPSREGKKGEYAVGLGEHDGHEYTILFCSETFPLDILNKINFLATSTTKACNNIEITITFYISNYWHPILIKRTSQIRISLNIYSTLIK